MNEKKLNLKVRWDSAFDELFFSKKFIEEFLKTFKYVSAGLTLDTRFKEGTDIPYFALCAKRYGYEFSGEHVVGDFTINKKANFNEEMLKFCVKYLKENNEEIFNEISNYEIIF